MQSESGSPEPCPDCAEEEQERAQARSEWRARVRQVSMTEFKAAVREAMGGAEFNPELPSEVVTLAELRAAMARGLYGGDHSADLTAEEQDRVDNGEPYCFRCGKPASSFGVYEEFADMPLPGPLHVAEYVRQEEGTYNPTTNRFACDGCYIAIGMPATSSGEGWKAP